MISSMSDARRAVVFGVFSRRCFDSYFTFSIYFLSDSSSLSSIRTVLISTIPQTCMILVFLASRGCPSKPSNVCLRFKLFPAVSAPEPVIGICNNSCALSSTGSANHPEANPSIDLLWPMSCIGEFERGKTYNTRILHAHQHLLSHPRFVGAICGLERSMLAFERAPCSLCPLGCVDVPLSIRACF